MQESLKASHVRSLVSVITVVLLIASSIGVAGCTATHAQQKSPGPIRVSTLQDNDRPGSLRYAIEKAQSGGTIAFDVKLHGTILLTSGDLNIDKELTIRGPGAGMLAISSGKSGYSIHIVPGVTVTISGLTFKNSNTSTGFIDNEGTLTLSNSTVSGNTATGDGVGGGITNHGRLMLSNSTVLGNMTTGNNGSSGGISNVSDGTVMLSNSIVSENTTTGNESSSGGISNVSGSTVMLSNSTVSGNKASLSNYGTGGIYNNGTLTLSNSTISGNTGGGINNDKSGTVMLSNSTISGNMVVGSGGGGISNGGMLMLSNSTISNNTGGGIGNSGTVTVSNSTISGNMVVGWGGGGIDNNGMVTISNSTISGNTAAIVNGANGGGGYNAGSGGGILNELHSTLMLTNSTIFANMAQYSGGGITNEGTFTLTNSTISGNTAGGGGGIYNELHGTFMLTNSTIFANSAQDGGGIDTGGALLFANSTVTDNTATGKGGGIFIQSSTFSGQSPEIAHATLIFSTISGNTASAGGDIAIEDIDNDNNKPITQISQVKIGNSIVVGDPAHPGPDMVGILTSSGYNLFQDNAGATFDPATSKQHGTDRTLSANDVSNLFTAPVSLQDNGGPTLTYALAPGSPALDAIPLQDCQVKGIFNSQSGMYTDQRGVKRPDGNEQFCDIGAYEFSSGRR